MQVISHTISLACEQATAGWTEKELAVSGRRGMGLGLRRRRLSPLLSPLLSLFYLLSPRFFFAPSATREPVHRSAMLHLTRSRKLTYIRVCTLNELK